MHKYSIQIVPLLTIIFAVCFVLSPDFLGKIIPLLNSETQKMGSVPNIINRNGAQTGKNTKAHVNHWNTFL